jgi:hypothetical protein
MYGSGSGSGSESFYKTVANKLIKAVRVPIVFVGEPKEAARV